MASRIRVSKAGMAERQGLLLAVDPGLCPLSLIAQPINLGMERLAFVRPLSLACTPGGTFLSRDIRLKAALQNSHIKPAACAQQKNKQPVFTNVAVA